MRTEEPQQEYPAYLGPANAHTARTAWQEQSQCHRGEAAQHYRARAETHRTAGQKCIPPAVGQAREAGRAWPAVAGSVSAHRVVVWRVGARVYRDDVRR